MVIESGDIVLTDEEFHRIKQRVYTLAGIAMGDAKRTLMVSRLMRLVRERRFESFANYLDFLDSSEAGPKDQQDFVNALTTNLTRFYREDHHFEHLLHYVQHIIRTRGHERRGQKLRIWSAGCSTGQEPYTIALALLAAYPELKRWDFKILATDIDTLVVQKAARGIYPVSELSGLSPERARPFKKVDDNTIKVPDEVRKLITFKQLNLHDDWPMSGPFDAIFCRNVAIYFDKPTQRELFMRLGDMLVPGGFLYIGHSETIPNAAGYFSLVGKTIYQTPSSKKSRDAA